VSAVCLRHTTKPQTHDEMMRNNKNKGGNYNEKIDNQKIKSTTFLNLLRNEFEKQKTKKRERRKKS